MRKLNQKWMVAMAALVLAQPMVRAQDQGVGDMMFTAGTVATNASSQDWAWLQWMATESALLMDRPMDIYLKAGLASSGNLFELQGTARQVTDPRSIALLLQRGEALGDNMTNLVMSIDSLYAGAEPVASLSLEEKLSALIDGSQADFELYRNLVLMGRAHPSVAMAIGHGYACRIPSSGFSTFEIRDHHTAEVIGRVVLEGGAPLELPAPGPIARVPETSPKGNLNIRLNWDIPNDLKRVSLLQFGYNLYRIDQDFAEGFDFDTTPPKAHEIAELVSNNVEVVQVNRMPILVDEDAPWFAVDDNEGLSGGTPFKDGTNYYYFVSALDLLGRDGTLSDGFLTAPCDRFAPSVPHSVRTRTISGYSGGNRTQWVEVSWAHNTNDTDTAQYYVYRHTGLADMQSNAVSSVSNQIAGPISSTSDTRMYYEDHSLTTNEWSQTYWYTVRAEDAASCGANLSGNSAPAYGLVRDWEGPPPATGVVLNIYVETPITTHLSETNIGFADPNNLRMTCELASPNLPIAWTQFGWHWGDYEGPGSETNINASGRLYFPEGTDEISRDYFIDSAAEPNQYVVTVYCRVGSAHGAISEWARVTNEKPGAEKKEFIFKGDVTLTQVPIPSGGSGPVPGPHVWGGGITNLNPSLFIPAVGGAESVRVYRRVDGGPRTLIHQGEMDEVLGALITDYTGGSVNGGTICYYYQLFDEHGNASPMVLIICIGVSPRVDLPTPVLKSIDSIGAATAAPGLALEWFCTTPGVERFELAVALDDGGPLPTFGTLGYALEGGVANEIEVILGGVTNTLDFGFYRTGRVGTTFGVAGSPEFLLESLISLDRDFTIMVRAIGVVGTPGPWSNVETFRWSTVPAVGPEVPWPTRAPPTVQSTKFHADMEVVFIDGGFVLSNGFDHVGIRIGELPPNAGVEEIKTGEIQLFNSGNPMDHLYANAVQTNQTVMPCVLYRYQLTNDLYQTVSGDVAQVSPLMEDIAYGTSGATVSMYDPYIAINKQTRDPHWGIYLIDTQPVVRGVRYQYLLMRFDEQTKELDRIIPAGTVTIP